jgi:hypothetical protein
MREVEVETPVRSNTHKTFAVEVPPYAALQPERDQGGEGHHILRGRFTVGDNFQLETWLVVDSLLAALSIGGGVFSRQIWTRRPNYRDIRTVGLMPSELWMPALRVIPNRTLEPTDGEAYREPFERIRDRVLADPDSLAILMFYTVSCWLFNADLIREAGMNYFSVVEAVLPRLTNQPPGASLFGKKVLADAGRQVGLDAAGVASIEAAADARSDLAHGRLDHLIHSQQVLGANPATSISLREPALVCKTAADATFALYFGV